MREVNKWIRYAEKRKAAYTHLVKDHNNIICQEFSKSPTRYLEMLKTAKKDLEKLLNSIPKPTGKGTFFKKVIRTRRKKKKLLNVMEGGENLDSIDVGYGNEEIKHKVMDISDEKVKDRWSRYIGAMGLEAVKK